MGSIPNSNARRRVKRYSPKEATLLRLIPKGVRPINSVELAKRLYEGDDVPDNPLASVTSIMKSLIRKVDSNREAFSIVKSDPRGPYPVEYRKVERK